MYSILKTAALTLVMLATTSSGHSWLECTNDEVRNMNALKSGDKSVYPDWTCHGYPRNKRYHGDWIQETKEYLWDLGGVRAKNEAPPGQQFACNPLQRSPVYPGNVPAAQAKPGQTLLLRFWGNGHTSWAHGAPIHHDPGLVRIYDCGKDGSIMKASELTPDKMIAESNFSANAITYQRADGGPDDRANWMSLEIPGNWEGRRCLVWTWAPTFSPFENDWRDQYTTCFDVFVTGPKVNTPTPGKVGQPGQSNNDKSQPGNGVNPQCKATCFRGGMPEYPCNDGVNCPPCRYYSNGVQTCFEYSKDGVCPPWANGFDCKKNLSV